MRPILLLILAVVSLSAPSAQAFVQNSIGLGAGLYSQNLMQLSQNEKGEAKFLGTPSTVINLKFDFHLGDSWFLAPQVTYLPMARSTAGDTAKISFYHVVFQIGANLLGSNRTNFDVYAGPGFIDYQIKGAGGTVTMNNGTGTATFARPGRDVEVKKITANIGSSFTLAGSRFGTDFIVENPGSKNKRGLSLMFSYTYQFGGKK